MLLYRQRLGHIGKVGGLLTMAFPLSVSHCMVPHATPNNSIVEMLKAPMPACLSLLSHCLVVTVPLLVPTILFLLFSAYFFSSCFSEY